MSTGVRRSARLNPVSESNPGTPAPVTPARGKRASTIKTAASQQRSKRKSTSDLAEISLEKPKKQTKRKSVANFGNTEDQPFQKDASPISSQEVQISSQEETSSQDTTTNSQDSQVSQSSNGPSKVDSAQEDIAPNTLPKAKNSKTAKTIAPKDTAVTFRNLLTDEGIKKSLEEFQPSDVNSKEFTKVVSVVGGSHPIVFDLLIGNSEDYDFKRNLDLAKKLYTLILTSSTNNNSFLRGTNSFVAVVKRLISELENPKHSASYDKIFKLVKGVMSLWITHTEVDREELSDLIFIFIKLLALKASSTEEELTTNVNSVLYFTGINKRILINSLCSLSSGDVQSNTRLMKPLFSSALDYVPSIADTPILIKWMSLSREASRCGWADASHAGINAILGSREQISKEFASVLRFVFGSNKNKNTPSNSELISQLISGSNESFEQVVEAVNVVNQRVTEMVTEVTEEGEPLFFVDTSGKQANKVSKVAPTATLSASEDNEIQAELDQLINSLKETKDDASEDDSEDDNDT